MSTADRPTSDDMAAYYLASATRYMHEYTALFYAGSETAPLHKDCAINSMHDAAKYLGFRLVPLSTEQKEAA